ncbi:hypothetical protein Syun_026533 [Stephania yunnanensis]|uniref:Midasin n=1 Tax=Stephania yunnanensis TaxID=152371 RepID=A0AAP0F0T1_9MAGN
MMKKNTITIVDLTWLHVARRNVEELTGMISLGALWRRVMIDHPSNKDMVDIVNSWHPNLELVARKLVETYEKVNSGSSHGYGGLQFLGRFSVRDLLKWCKRIASLEFGTCGLSLSANESRSIYQEAVDIFAASSASKENRLLIMKEIAKIWAVPVLDATTLVPSNRPIIQDSLSNLRIGRVALKHGQAVLKDPSRSFVNIRNSLHLLERVACSVKYNEPVLLVGETGTGKTTLVQSLATRLGQPITVLNLSQQSDVADLLGGLKPIDPRFIFVPLYNEFMNLFSKTFSVKDNMAEGKFLHSLKNIRNTKDWRKMMKVFQKGLHKVLDYHSPRRQIDSASSMTFSFVEGAFVQALRNGHWILLDEVNLAPPDTLQRIKGVLEGEHGSICLAERGDINYIDRHPNFRVFACMNPATDSGKRDLPYSLRSRFTEYFLDDILNEEDLTLFVNQFIDDSRLGKEMTHKIVQFYIGVKKESEERLQDGANQKPHFSLRSLFRALEYTKRAKKKFGFLRALYDGLCMFFLTLLDGPSAKFMNSIIKSNIFGGKIPPDVSYKEYLAESIGPSEFFNLETPSDNNYILTDSVSQHLRNLSRAILIKRYPVLLQGPTSSGKTSLVQYLASVTGHEFLRINNHEHTDVQEYLGSYVTDTSGKLVFQEGALVKAVRNGWWIVLDELNLAPSDVLEALNRLLDDNRELFVPDLQETIQAHPKFMLFATQNPPTLYGGRKMLSRAFRNRFVEIHVDEIPECELSEILEKRCKIPSSYAKTMVEVMKDLQLHRQNSQVFAGKHGFITPRDLFRWADRYRLLGDSREDLARDGYYLLAERLRDENEKKTVQEILERHFGVKLFKDNLYMQESIGGILSEGKYDGVSEHPKGIIWTRSMQRLYFLVDRCYKMREPVLLVGETGGGKTTVCQLLSIGLELKLHMLNCHQHTETSDFLGGFYPVRRSRLTEEFHNLVEQLMLSNVLRYFPSSVKISPDIGQAVSTFDQLNIVIQNYRQGKVPLSAAITSGDIDTFERMKEDLFELYEKWQTIFTWQDGPLVQAMKDGDLFLLDEISLADDSVLERLNSVLETERKLSLAEKGGSVLETITAHPKFFLLATMNPGGDYGKKELSPALRNRFTEIWVPPVTDLHELHSIAAQRSDEPTLPYVDPMLNFWKWFNQLQMGRILTVRDLLSWIDFINLLEKDIGSMHAFLHGAFLVLLDGLSLGTGMLRHEAGLLRERSLSFLLECLKSVLTGGEPEVLFLVCSYWWRTRSVYQANHLKCGQRLVKNSSSPISELETYGWGNIGVKKQVDIMCSEHQFGEKDCSREGFEFLAPTTCRNAMRLLRAMQLTKPVLLEGSPGVGKTSLVVALGKYSGHTVVRINLSEQTDMMDLLGSDLPTEDMNGMKFAWSDGILLQALKKGYWVLLDELNLAPQSVLEAILLFLGLNAILDHRAEVFIPELGATFKCQPSFRVFACQNPSRQGGGRKGLPKSFLNRFTKVYVDELVEDDYLSICSSLHPSVPRSILSKLISFNKRLYEDTMLFHKYGEDGSPWEFNLRDVIRSCQIIEGVPEKSKVDCFLSVVYLQRMRTAADRQNVLDLYRDVFGVNPFINPYPRVQINRRYLTVGDTSIMRNHTQPDKLSNNQLHILPGIRHSLEAVAHCVKYQWLCILVGPTASGKTSLVRLLAQLTGNVLNELNLSSTTDVSELLGSFEQYNAYRNFRVAVAKVERYIDEYCSLRFEFVGEDGVERKNLISRWLAFLSGIDFSPTSSSASIHTESWNDKFCDSLSSLVHIIEQLKLGLKRCSIDLSSPDNELDKILENILDLQEKTRKQTFPVKFEWVTGLLLRAIESGEWVILEMANLCNPTVLDRINSLVESNGSITVNECGLVEGKPLVLYPHPNFRLFLTVNPKYGEVSRAMRNRGVEVFLMQPYWLADGKDDGNCKETEIKDVKRLLVLSGIPIRELVDAMAEAHMFARDIGAKLGVRITLLEVTRWIQLFQQLLVNGNNPVWSLHLSWEHTYLSSLGEAEGRDAIEHAKMHFLSASNFTKILKTHKCSLSLPGGWPTPLKLRNFSLFSNETSIKQNCMYLEFLGSQFASYELNSQPYRNHIKIGSSLSVTGTGLLVDDSQLYPSTVPLQMLSSLVFPTTSDKLNLRYSEHSKFDTVLANTMLFFAANWTIEQATESDFKLYLLWFNWCSSKLQHCSKFFESYTNILQQEIEHPIWKCIYERGRELTSSREIDVDLQPPMLSLKFMEFPDSSENIIICKKHLYNAVQCVRLLRLSLQQWNSEEYDSRGLEIQCFIPLLKSLRNLEKKILDELVVSPSFDLLFQLYNNVLESHIFFWNSIISSKLDGMIISWSSLKKNAKKLESFFPDAVNSLLVECRNTLTIADGNFDSPKSLLWVYGGHPLLPSSSNVYEKMQQLLDFCKSTWSLKSGSWKQASSENDDIVKIIISINPELRTLAMQGVCMLSYFMRKGDEDVATVVQQLEDMHQVLLERFKNEKHNIETVLASNADKSLVENAVNCCIFGPEVSCLESSFGISETLTFFDGTSLLLDMDLLQQLSDVTLVDAEKLLPALSSTSGMLELALNFSLKFSSRPPTDFLPHQTLLWVLDAWQSVESANSAVTRSVLDMWFRWHSSLWLFCHEQIDSCDIPLPHVLSLPVKARTVHKILQGVFPVKDYTMNALKLRVASENIWRDSTSGRDISNFLLTAARSLFQQVILAHEKSFGQKEFVRMKAIMSCIRGRQAKVEELQELKSLIASSNHSKLTSLMDLYIEPLLKMLFFPTNAFLGNLGCAWLLIGGLRLHLLLSRDDLDPATKYALKHSQLVEKISLLELELQVRQECEHLVGRNSTKDGLNQGEHILQGLEIKRKKLLKKVVFRHDPENFTMLKSECADFQESCVLKKDLKAINIEVYRNWQETAKSFIERLTDEYAAYVDIAQPIQVAVYEMKLGMSLVLSNTLQNTLSDMIGGVTSSQIMETLCYFMQYPRILTARDIENCMAETLSSDVDDVTNNRRMNVKLLRKLCTIAREKTFENEVSSDQSHASLLHNMLVRVTHFVGNSLLMDDLSFKVLHEIFEYFSGLWMNMKVETRAKKDDESQRYKFKPRAFNIDSLLDLDTSNLGSSFCDKDLCLEWQEMLAEDDSTQQAPLQEHENLMEEWKVIEDSLMQDIVHLHNQLFGSRNLVEPVSFFYYCSSASDMLYVDLRHPPATVELSEADKLYSFLESYKLGMGIVKDPRTLPFSSLDAKLGPEHLLYLCLEYEEKFGLPQATSHVPNIYKNSNAIEMARMVKPLRTLQQRVISLLTEWPDHHVLENILDITKVLLTIPLNTPLAKALYGLQFLLRKSHFLQEISPKLSVSDQVQPILSLVSCWQKMELDSWPALLDEVQEQCDSSAAKFFIAFTPPVMINIQFKGILDEFVKSSSIGEFKKRLQLLLAFYGQVNVGVCLKFYSSSNLMDNVKILFNIFGYYMQFLPRVMEHIEANKRKIATELKELVKLCRWERLDSYLLIETSKRTRQKLRKLIQKFNDVLQQPVMGILNQDLEGRGLKPLTTMGPKVSDTISELGAATMLPVAIDLAIFSDVERSTMNNVLREKINSDLCILWPRRVSSGFSPPHTSIIVYSEEVATAITQSLSSQDSCFANQEEWTGVWFSLENISTTIITCASLWNNKSKSFGKKRALYDLLKLLEGCGLSRHKSLVAEGDPKSSQATSYFLQPSYNVHHLLLNVDTHPDNKLPTVAYESTELHCRMANQYYYKSIAAVELLRQICLNFHKDFGLEQVVRSASFLDHLVSMQQEQRHVGYNFAEQLERLRKYRTYLKDLPKTSTSDETNNKRTISVKQQAVHESMWKQKQLFDGLFSFTQEASLLLRKVENTHLNTCQNVKVATNKAHVFIEKLVLDLKKSKESLDEYLVGGDKTVTLQAAFSHPFVVSEQMERLVLNNFQCINEFQERVQSYLEHNVDKRSVLESLFGRLGDILNQGKDALEDFRSHATGISKDDASAEISDIRTAFADSYTQSLKQIKEALNKLSSTSHSRAASEDSLSGNITEWKVVAESFIVNIQLDCICEGLGQTIKSAVRLIDHAGEGDPNLCSEIQMCLNFLNVLMDIMLTYGDAILHEFFAMHRTVAEVTHMLASVFASLFSKGFGTPLEENADNGDATQDATGTGMGEGAGLNDVSDQITDEDQLLGISEKAREPDAQNEVLGKDEKGIEMDQDFAADTFSVSEDSENDDGDEDDEDDKLESAMGEAGNGSEVVDEKLWDKEEDGPADDANESYEPGQSVKDMDSNSRELRAKEDNAAGLDESGEYDVDESRQREDVNENVPDEDENMDDLQMDKETAYTDPTEIQFDEQNEAAGEEDVDMEEPEGSDKAEVVPDDYNETVENANDEGGDTNPVDDDMETESGEVGDNLGSDDQGKDQLDDREDLSKPNKNELKPEMSPFQSEAMPSTDSATRPSGDGQASDSSMVAQEAQWANSSDMQNGLAPARGLPSDDAPQAEIEIPDSHQGGKLNADQPKSTERDTSSVQRSNPNPYRSLGDALEKWKERVKVSMDSLEHKADAPDAMEDDNADEYGFVSELEKGTSQALGSATSDQIDKNFKGNKPDAEEGIVDERDHSEKDVENQYSETSPVTSNVFSTLTKKVDERPQNAGLNGEDSSEGLQNIGKVDDASPIKLSESLVSMNRSYMSEEIMQLSNLTVNEDDMGKAKNLDESLRDNKGNSTALWRKYELTTSRLSQELAEQLRLVMEPTVASKLQGDYKTGKRINMKKVIPYIASHYRRDKIWLRRTRPNKRDYQVVVAVDDSRSMSESHCGSVAIEALVTVCRAMSQLDVGQLAVASFGKKGNIKLLHDFNQPFTGEAGMNMISSLTFKQENTIADEPVVDLLMYLNNMLDAAVANARLPSGQNPLQQLVLIIGDGRFHEKGKIRRCVRDLLSKKRMVAFLIVDSPQESITNLDEISFVEEELLKFPKLITSKYLNSFVFPYYIILKNIEALPKTLADLIRQCASSCQRLTICIFLHSGSSLCNQPEHIPVAQTILTLRGIEPETVCLTHTISSLLFEHIRLVGGGSERSLVGDGDGDWWKAIVTTTSGRQQWMPSTGGGKYV